MRPEPRRPPLGNLGGSLLPPQKPFSQLDDEDDHKHRTLTVSTPAAPAMTPQSA